MIAVAASPLGQLLATEAGNEAGKCHGRTCGFMGYFAVILMFLVLCGGVWLLLQSSFGPLQAYLVSSIAFWGCWFVLALIWFTGVPGFSTGFANAALPGDPLPNVSRSTPRYYGPQGGLPSWAQAPASVEEKAAFVDAAGAERTSDVERIQAAQTAASDLIAKHYGEQLEVDPKTITVPQIVEITGTEIARGGGGIKYVRLTTGPAKPGETATGEEQELIKKIKAASFVLEYDEGTEARPTQIALLLTFGLFAVHMFGLMWYERRYRPVTEPTARERERATAGV